MAGSPAGPADGEKVQPDDDTALARLGHEVRTALAAILGHAELLGAAVHSEDVRNSATQISGEGRRLLSILESVMPCDSDDPGGAKHRVLHLEDDPANVRLVSRLLTAYANVELHSASGVDEGIGATRALRPDLILLDLHLEDGSGEQVLDALEADPELRTIPVVITSGDPASVSTDRPRSMVRAHLAKPMDLDEFDRLVRCLLRLTPAAGH